MPIASIAQQQCATDQDEASKSIVDCALPDLLSRARRVLETAAVTSLVLLPLAMQPAAAAMAVPTGDLVVEKSGAYYYNESGFFVDSSDKPTGSAYFSGNTDGSTKLFGSASASSAEFVQHNCNNVQYIYCGTDRGVALVWSGTLAEPAAVGNRLAINVDFNIAVPDTGGSWSFGARWTDYSLNDFSSLSGSFSSSQSGSLSEGSYRVHGQLLFEPLEYSYTTTFWQVYVGGVAGAPRNEGFYSDQYEWIVPYRGLSITAPQKAIDVHHVDESYVSSGELGLTVSAVPEPSEWMLLLLGLGVLGARKLRRC